MADRYQHSITKLFRRLFFFSLLFVYVSGFSQHNSLSGKTVAVYISKKNLLFDAAYFKPLAYYLQVNDSLGLSEEDLKLGVSVKLGYFLQQEIARLTGAHVIFLNADPALAKPFLEYYDDSRPNPRLNTYLPKVDYIFYVSAINLSTITESQLWVISNKLINEKKKRFIGKATFIWEKSGDVKAYKRSDLVWSNGATTPPEGFQDFFQAQEQSGEAAKLLANLCNAFWTQLDMNNP
ncbi:MAG: hypothetical protein LC115_04515 [Bacteroidia bacterium]|nr:hypothetical protein [Bacteroidia bacterium]